VCKVVGFTNRLQWDDSLWPNTMTMMITVAFTVIIVGKLLVSCDLPALCLQETVCWWIKLGNNVGLVCLLLLI